METESRMIIARGWGEGTIGSCYLIGTEFVLQDEKFWRLHNNVTILNVTELYA